MNLPTIYRAILLAIVVIHPITACQQKKAAATKKNTSTSTYSNTSTGTSGNVLPTTTNTITITCSAAQGTTLYVTLNQPVSWVFSATSSSGATPTMQISASPQHATMQINGSTVNFTPSQADLTGSISVTANGTNGANQSSVFSWMPQQGTTTGGGLFGGGGMGGIFGSLLQMFLPQLGGMFGGGAGGIGGLLGGGMGGLGGVNNTINNGQYNNGQYNNMNGGQYP